MVLVTLMTATHTYRFSEFQTGLVESGVKRCTIRALRRAPTRAGDTLRLTGPIFAGRGKTAAKPGRLLRTAVCRSVHGTVLTLDHETSAVILFDITGETTFECVPTCVDELARMDGFESALVMGQFFRKRCRHGAFRGVLIRW